jgi:hypothetical protein
MQSVKGLNPPLQYSVIWLIIGLVLLLAIISWYGFTFWLTRRRPVKSLATIKQLSTASDLNQLKANYLQRIEACFQQYQRQEISLRSLHQTLSMLIRLFIYDVRHFPAPRLTLADLKLSAYPTLTELVAAYYPSEFTATEIGDAQASVNAAKGFIQQWV